MYARLFQQICARPVQKRVLQVAETAGEPNDKMLLQIFGKKEFKVLIPESDLRA